MPTKPVSTLGALWASNANWSSGPQAGQPTKLTPTAGELANGQVGGITYKCQWDNFALNFLTEWVENWVRLGLSTNAANAHIVETDANGIARAQKLEAVLTNNALLAAILADAQGTTTCLGIQGVGGSVSGAGVNGISQTASAGVLGQHTNGDGPGVSGIGRLAGAGVTGLGGATGSGGDFEGGSSAGDGVTARGTATRPGVRGTGGATAGTGVLGIAGSTGGIGVEGQTIASALSTTFAVRGLTGSGDATGVWGNSSAGAGYGLVAHADTSEPTRSALRVVPQNADPSTAADGDVYYCDDGGNDDHLMVFSRSAWRGVWATNGGHARGYAEDQSQSSTASLVAQTKVTTNLAAPYHPRRAGQVVLHAVCEVGKSVAGDVYVDLYDATAGAVVASWTGPVADAGATANYRHVAFVKAYTLPAPGARTFELRYSSVTADTARIRGASLEVEGVY